MHFSIPTSELDLLTEMRLATLDVATTSAHLQRRLLEARARPRPAEHVAAPPRGESARKPTA